MVVWQQKQETYKFESKVLYCINLNESHPQKVGIVFTNIFSTFTIYLKLILSLFIPTLFYASNFNLFNINIRL